MVTYDFNLRPFLHHFREFKSVSLARAVIPTSAGAHTYVLTVVFGRASTWPAIDITEYALPAARGLTCGDGQLVNFWRCIAVRLD